MKLQILNKVGSRYWIYLHQFIIVVFIYNILEIPIYDHLIDHINDSDKQDLVRCFKVMPL